MAERRLITDRSLKALAPAPSGQRVELFDTRVPGFDVRISDTEDSNPARRGKAGKLTFILYARFSPGGDGAAINLPSASIPSWTDRRRWPATHEPKKVRCRHVHDYADDESDKFFALARSFNDASLPPRDDTEVMKTAGEVWTDRHKLQRWVGGRATTRTNHDKIYRINAHGKKNAGDALLLLQNVRLWHGARVEPFTLITDLQAPKLGWSRKRVEKALAILIKLRLIVKVSKFKVTAAGPVAARYRLASPNPTGAAAAGP